MPFLVRWPAAIKPRHAQRRDGAEHRFRADLSRRGGSSGVRPRCRAGACCPILRGRTPADWRTSMYYRYYHDPGDHNTRAHYGVRTRTHKLIHFWKKDQWELFDLVNDPLELHNLYGQRGPGGADGDAESRARAGEAGGARRRPARGRTAAERRRRAGGEAAGKIGFSGYRAAIDPACRTFFPVRFVSESPRSSRARSANSISVLTTSGCRSARFVVSPGSISRSKSDNSSSLRHVLAGAAVGAGALERLVRDAAGAASSGRFESRAVPCPSRSTARRAATLRVRGVRQQRPDVAAVDRRARRDARRRRGRAIVGSRSIVIAGCAPDAPAGIRPGQRAMNGTRTPPSNVVPLPSRNGAGRPGVVAVRQPRTVVGREDDERVVVEPGCASARRGSGRPTSRSPRSRRRTGPAAVLPR